MKAQAAIRLDFSSEKQLKAVLDALGPETKTSVTSRSEVQMNADDQSLVLKLRATDISALRAALNSYLRLIIVARDLQKLTAER